MFINWDDKGTLLNLNIGSKELRKIYYSLSSYIALREYDNKGKRELSNSEQKEIDELKAILNEIRNLGIGVV